MPGKAGWRQSNMGPLKVVSSLFKSGVLKNGARLVANRPAATSEMSILGHLKELRQHIVASLKWFSFFLVLSLIFMDDVIKFLRYPFEQYMISKGKNPQLVSLGLFEVVMMNFKICILSALTVSIPFILREIWAFVEPALFESERKFVKPLMISSIILFYIGVAFGFYIIVPAFISSTLDWASEYARVELTVESYFSSLTTMIMMFGVIFEVPVIMSLLGMAGIIHSTTLTKNRKFVFFGSIVTGTVLSPPDIFSQTVVSLPLYGMMEISIYILRYIEKNRLKETSTSA